MLRPRLALLGVAACALAVAASVLLAHPDDPKARHRVPPFPGHGTRGGGGDGDGSLALTVDFPSSGMTLLSWMSIPDLAPGMTSANDCWGYVSPSGREYAIIGLSDGTAFVEVTDPVNPVIAEVVAGPNSLWRDIETYSHYAYAVSEGGSGIQVIDLAQIDSGVATVVNTVTTPATTATHTIAIDTRSGFLYRCGGGSNGLRIYSLATPSTPVYVGAWPDRYVHEVRVVTFESGPNAGRQIAFACGGFNGGFTDTGLDILDVTNKSSIQVLSHLSYSNAAFSHQAWLSEDGRTLFLDDELDEEDFSIPTTIKVIDVSNLASPDEIGEFTNGSAAIGHNLFVVGNLLYAANYRSGIRVFDVTEPLSGVEVAWFDTWVEDDNPEFNGLWGNYPFLPSGTIVGSDLEKGLFLWRLGEPRLTLSVPGGPPETIEPSGDVVRVNISENSPGDLVPGSAVLRYDAGAGFVETPLVAVGGGVYEGTIPAVPCGATVAYYFAARDVEGFTATAPNAAPGAGTFTAVAAIGVRSIFSRDMETDPGFATSAPGDNATTGVWIRVDPHGTVAQPEDDHTTAPGAVCFVTGQGSVGGGDGENDVDGGTTTLVTSRLDFSEWANPVISYWRWYSNNTGSSPGADTLVVDVSANDGASWTNVETVGPAGAGAIGGWIEHRFKVADFVTPTGLVKIRIVASDLGSGSIVEAAVDDLAAFEYVCRDCNGNGIDDTSDIKAGRSADGNGDGVPDECAIFTLQPPVPGIAGGVVNVVSVENATPLGQVCFFAGFSAGTTNPTECPAVPLGIRNAKRVACRAADNAGAITLSKRLGSGLVGRTAYIQALDVATCTASNLVIHAFP